MIATASFVGPAYRELKRDFGNGTSLSFLDASGTQAQGYDAVKRVTGLRHLLPGGVTLRTLVEGFGGGTRSDYWLAALATAPRWKARSAAGSSGASGTTALSPTWEPTLPTGAARSRRCVRLLKRCIVPAMRPATTILQRCGSLSRDQLRLRQRRLLAC